MNQPHMRRAPGKRGRLLAGSAGPRASAESPETLPRDTETGVCSTKAGVPSCRWARRTSRVTLVHFTWSQASAPSPGMPPSVCWPWRLFPKQVPAGASAPPAAAQGNQSRSCAARGVWITTSPGARAHGWRSCGVLRSGEAGKTSGSSALEPTGKVPSVTRARVVSGPARAARVPHAGAVRGRGRRRLCQRSHVRIFSWATGLPASPPPSRLDVCEQALTHHQASVR